MIPRKKWATYTAHEKELMKTAVTHASPDEYFTPEYAAAFIGVSPRTLQSWRDNDSSPSHRWFRKTRWQLWQCKQCSPSHRWFRNYKKRISLSLAII